MVNGEWFKEINIYHKSQTFDLSKMSVSKNENYSRAHSTHSMKFKVCVSQQFVSSEVQLKLSPINV